MLTARQVSVHQTTKDQIMRYLNLNAIPQDSYSINPDNGDSYNVYTAFFYSFTAHHNTQTVAGGKSSTKHFSNTGYKNYFYQCYDYANNATAEKTSFLNKVVSSPIDYFLENSTYTIWKSEQFSYSYDCGNCGGRGKVTCSSCGGSGKKRCYACGGSGTTSEYVTRTDSSGHQYSQYVTRNCSSCSGSGRTTCSGCGGSGYNRCGTCSGHGFFTEYCQVYTNATPSTKHGADQTGLHHDILLNFLDTKSNKFFCNHFVPKFISHAWSGNNVYVLNFSSTVDVAETRIALKGGPAYYEVGANTIGSMIFPPLFDHYYKNIINHYQVSNSRSNLSSWLPFVSLVRTRRFYHTMKDDPFWSAMFKAYSEAGDADKKYKIQSIRDRAKNQSGGYISQKFAEKVGTSIHHLMSRASPHTTRIIWWSCYLLLFVVEILFGHALFSNISAETVQYPSPSHPFYWLNHNWKQVFYGLVMFYSFSMGALAPIASVLNIVVTKMRQSGVQVSHKPRVLNRKHVKRLAYLTAMFYVISAVLYSYGSASGYEKYIHKISQLFGIHALFLKIVRFIIDTALPFAIEQTGALGSLTRPWVREMVGHSIKGSNYSLGLVELILLIGIPLYFLPTIVSVFRKKRWFYFLLGNIILVPLFAFPWFILMYFALV